jgi:uncharacterized cupin superfamily protein
VSQRLAGPRPEVKLPCTVVRVSGRFYLVGGAERSDNNGVAIACAHTVFNATSTGGNVNDTARELAAKLIRNFNEVELNAEVRAPLYETLCTRLASGTAAQKLGASIDIVAPGKCSCPYHFHYAQEEMFVILDGEGTLRVAGELLPIRGGDVIFIPPGPQYPHQIVNSSEAPLKYLSISTRDDPEVVEYPDSGKYQAIVRGARGGLFTAIQRKENSLDYWDAEP